MATHKNKNWNLPEPKLESWEQVIVAVLMDIRDELQANNRHLSRIETQLSCHRIQRMFSSIERLDKRLSKKLPLKAKP